MARVLDVEGPDDAPSGTRQPAGLVRGAPCEATHTRRRSLRRI